MQTYCWWWLFFWLFASLDVLQASKISVTKKWSLSVMRPADGGKTSILVHQPLFMTPCVNPVDALAAMPSVLLWHAVNNGNKENIKEPLCAHMSYFRCQKDYRWHFFNGGRDPHSPCRTSVMSIIISSYEKIVFHMFKKERNWSICLQFWTRSRNHWLKIS